MPLTRTSPVRISVVDDHSLFRKGLINLIHSIDKKFEVISEAANGREFLEQLHSGLLPDIAIIDVSMPVMDGYQTTTTLRQTHSGLGILMLTMMDDEMSLIRLLRAGANGYLHKDVDPEELKRAIFSIAETGYYYTDNLTGKLVHALRNPGNGPSPTEQLSEQELRFIELACSEDTYAMIADKMCLSIKTIDGYRGKLFEKLNVKSRVGLVLYALRHGIVSLSP